MWEAWTTMVVVEMKSHEWLHDLTGIGIDRIYTWIIWGTMAEEEIKDFSLILARSTGETVILFERENIADD